LREAARTAVEESKTYVSPSSSDSLALRRLEVLFVDILVVEAVPREVVGLEEEEVSVDL
jgi:hypothetical protein